MSLWCKAGRTWGHWKKPECSENSCFIYVQSPSIFQTWNKIPGIFVVSAEKKSPYIIQSSHAAAPSARCWPGPVGVATWLNDLSKRGWWPWWMGCFFPHLLVLPFFIGEIGSFQASFFFFFGGGGVGKNNMEELYVFFWGVGHKIGLKWYVFFWSCIIISYQRLWKSFRLCHELTTT